MSLLDQINSLNKRIGDLDDRSAELGHQAWELRRERETLTAKFILEEELLAGSTWDVELGSFASGSSAYLNFTGQSSDKNSPIHKVVELARDDYHTNFALVDGVNIRFDDSEITLTFKEGVMMLPFIQKYGLVINGTSIQDRLAKLKRDVAALELVCHQLKL